MGIRFIGYLKYLFNCVSELVFDRGERCLTCENMNENDCGICSTCLNRIEFCSSVYHIKRNNSVFEYYSAAYYTNIIMELILKLKYKSDFKSGDALAHFMVEVIKKFNIQFDVLCYVPSSKAAFKRRGYNQSEYLCKVIGKIFNIKVSHALEKIIETKDQIGLNSDARWRNMKNSFVVSDNRFIRNKLVLLVDDVITTGATALYCAEELKKSGAKSVIILTAAKSRI
jgi:competence protein ComFC